MENTNEMELIFDSSPVNEGLARVTVAAFCTQLNPTLEEVADLKTAVSEAVTNCIIHAYEGKICKIRMTCRLAEKALWEWECQISTRLWNRFLPQSRRRTVQEWVLLLWRRLWTRSRWNLR